MKTKSGPNTYTDNKKLLKQQTFHISQNYWKGRMIDKQDTAPSKQIITNEREQIANILSEGNDFLRQRAVICDIVSNCDMAQNHTTELICKYGLSTKINNLNSFLDFCAMHGLIPMIDKISINGQDTTKIKEIQSLFSFALINKDPLIANIIFNEIEKIEAQLKGSSKDILEYLMKISYYTNYTYQHLFGERLEKTKSPGTLSENIFSEIALRLENQIRDKIDIESSYLKTASFEKDTTEKTDMHFVLKKEAKQEYMIAPVQFTISGNAGEKYFGIGSKTKSIEKFLSKLIMNKKYSSDNFIVLSVNGDFKEKISGVDEHTNLTQLYQNWLSKPEKRENGKPGKFPLFIDQIGDIGESAEVMYIALHMLYKKYNFRKSEQDNYISAFKLGKINKENTNTIKDISLSNIYISGLDLEKIQAGNKGEWFLKHEFNISYDGLPMGKIIIYAK